MKSEKGKALICIILLFLIISFSIYGWALAFDKMSRENRRVHGSNHSSSQKVKPCKAFLCHSTCGTPGSSFIRSYIPKGAKDIKQIDCNWAYFKLDGKIEEYEVTAGGGEYIPVDENLNPTGEFLTVENTEFDFLTKKKVANKEIDIALTNAKNGTTSITNGVDTVNLYADPAMFPYVQLFIPVGF